MEQVNNVEDYLNKLERYEKYSEAYYRGQLEKYQNITSSLSRDSGLVNNEYAIYHEAMNMRSAEFKGLITPIERLSKMQHYGIPTRLIDLTINPLTALFFAVQNVEDESSGNVFVYIKSGCCLDDRRLKLLSLLATLDSYDIDNIKKCFEEQYNETISRKEILEYASNNYFVRFSKDLQKSNPRLYNQDGTFAICGNEIKGKQIQRSIKPLDSITPSLTIRIPYEHKLSIKKELDERYNINETIIYPEFPSVADYLKNKYKTEDFNSSGTYNILEKKDLSNNGAKRVSIIVVLNKKMDIEKIKDISKEIIDQNKIYWDVIWIFVAKNGDDYITNNWLVRCQWVRPSLNSKYKPRALGPPDENNCRWKLEKSYSILSDYFKEYTFDDDKALYSYNMNLYNKIKPYYLEMVKTYKQNDFNQLEKLSNKNKGEFSKAFIKFGDFGLSRDKEFNKYLDNFVEFASSLCGIIQFLQDENLNIVKKRRWLTSEFKEAQEKYDAIEAHALYWKKRINLTASELEQYDPNKYKKKRYQYKQTLPINPNAIEVWFLLEITKNRDNTINISGKTNLFDKASIMITLSNSKGKMIAQGKSEVNVGKFDFGLFSRKGEGFLKGKYKAEISLPLPSVQNEEFVKKAGLEYENLKGKYVNRIGIGPTIKYCQEFYI